ncbi:ATP synthase F1 subunit epsilon [Aphanothece sacrum]|uniref:ATP synthase epsilon chain n=1 Tax=Aphanothece sacrum FPU1 TaxID=1920663 RepID=A0A401IKS1_APHSA|nr:ATP synthase F1 subunit epsilon [Aphanothece sacrum]GBF81849.1 ATP synthase epsilon chain [Aphanothece sacrum FPU1]GBF85668.1 ATP synthase epsilon chain [Aphanothece sacrum FPU3]
MSLTVRVITPDKVVWDGSVEEVILPSTSGQLGILKGHAPLLTALDIGVMRVRLEKDWKSLVVMGGFAEVENDELKVLVNTAEIGDAIDKESAKTEFSQAQSRLDEATKGGERRDQIQATTAYKRARARFQAAGGLV